MNERYKEATLAAVSKGRATPMQRQTEARAPQAPRLPLSCLSDMIPRPKKSRRMLLLSFHKRVTADVL
jgi:hypothetical protein